MHLQPRMEDYEMSGNFEKLKAKLADTGTLTDDEITAAGLTDEEKIWLNTERYAKRRDKQERITLGSIRGSEQGAGHRARRQSGIHRGRTHCGTL
ncbi:MAG: hypothetical protein IT324_10315 [Anaerolineae bacterium]|nr:hypothetical protein [Anaerolineae bacterium]